METLNPELLASVEELVKEGKVEQGQVNDEINAKYQERIAETKDKPKAPKRLIILDLYLKGNGPTKKITLADERIGAHNSEAFSPAQSDETLPTDFENIAGVIFSGSAANIEDKVDGDWINTVEKYMQELLARQIPVLGICFGMQLHADMQGRKTHRNLGGTEKGLWKSSLFMDAETSSNPIFKGIDFQRDANGQYASAIIPTLGFHNFRVDYDQNNEQTIHGYSYAPNLFNFGNFDMSHLDSREAYPMVEISGSFYGTQFHPEDDVPWGVAARMAERKAAAMKTLERGEDPFESIRNLESYQEELGDTQKGTSNLFIRNFLDICGVE